MPQFHIALGFDPSDPNPPSPNPNNWYGTLKYGYCVWTGVNCTAATQNALPTANNYDSMFFYLYQLTGSTIQSPAPSTSGLPSGSWITATPIDGTSTSATVFYAPFTTVQNVNLAQFGTTQVNSAVFKQTYPGPFWCWMLSMDGKCPYACIADNPNPMGGANETFSLVFQFNIGGNIWGIDPNMIIKPSVLA